MKMVRKYISCLMLLSILFPIGEKAIHDIKHFNEDHCEVKKTHYCKTEHICAICDYVFSTSSGLPLVHDQTIVFEQNIIILSSVIVFNTIISPKFTFTLRGPPVFLNLQNAHTLTTNFCV